MIGIGDTAICTICHHPITWNGKVWTHASFEEHEPAPSTDVQQEPKHVVLEVQSMTQRTRSTTIG
jgi:hypothetical protein